MSGSKRRAESSPVSSTHAATHSGHSGIVRGVVTQHVDATAACNTVPGVHEPPSASVMSAPIGETVTTELGAHRRRSVRRRVMLECRRAPALPQLLPPHCMSPSKEPSATRYDHDAAGHVERHRELGASFKFQPMPNGSGKADVRSTLLPDAIDDRAASANRRTTAPSRNDTRGFPRHAHTGSRAPSAQETDRFVEIPVARMSPRSSPFAS